MVDPEVLLGILALVKGGDFTARMPEGSTGSAGQIAAYLNEIITANQVLAAHAHEVETWADRMALLSDFAPIGIFQTDEAGLYSYTNTRWSEIMGIEADDALGEALDLPIGPSGISLADTEWLVTAGHPHELYRYFEIPCEASPARVVLLTATAIPDPLGGRTRWVGAVADVTAAVRAEASAAHFSAVVESSHDAIISKDLHGIITSWNAAAQRLYGYAPAEAIGHSISMIVPPGHGDEVSELLARVRAAELVDNYETIRVRKDRTIVDVSLTTSPILGPHGTVIGASVIARDISDRRKAEQLKDDFLAMVSHELRTPLSSIVARAELLLDDDDIEVFRRREFLEAIDRNAARLVRLVGDLLFVAQLESANLSLSMTDVDIVKVAAEAIEAATPWALQSSIDLVLVTSQASFMLTGDPGRLGQAFDNLISNAIKYSPAGGVVTVTISLDDGECAIEVDDHGIGISKAEQKHVFDRFFRAPTAVDLHIQGVGLGLLIVKEIVVGHRGRINVTSESGVGAKFRIALPLS